LEITKIVYYLNEGDSVEGCFLGRCSIVFSDTLIVHNVKIFNGLKGRYIVMPEKADECEDNKRWGKDVFHSLNKDFFNYMSKQVLEGYELYKGRGRFSYRPRN
jgi:DNA-binding cell septation regulator SpoVG